MKRIFLLTTIFIILFTACSSKSNQNIATVIYPTPTNYNLFSGIEVTSPAIIPGGNLTPVTPTVSNIFDPQVKASPQFTPKPVIVKNTAQPSKIDLSSINYKLVTIYGDQLNPDWRILNAERTEVDLDNDQFKYAGSKSIKITPGEDFSPVYFVVEANATQNYPRDRVLGIEFKLSPGKATIEPNNLAVTVMGSNQYSYYVAGDLSVTNKVDPIFPETRLNYLGINQMIPPQTWTDVVVWMDDLIYDPIYKNVTGFYIKNDAGFRDTFYVDDINLLLLSNEQASTIEGTPSASLTQPAPSSNEIVTSVQVNIDLLKDVQPINPMIYGISRGTNEILIDLKPGLNSWGGNPSSRYNWQLGNAWNAGRDSFYQNTNYNEPAGSASDLFLSQARNRNIATRMSLPTLGWVAKNSNSKSCSFPLSDGTCGNANEASCLNPGEIADPSLANVKSDLTSILEWVRHIVIESNLKVNIIAMDNEPELWGITHYDVHPQCTTYQEILDKYLEYAPPVRQLAPKVELAGPVTSGWQYYWNSAAGEKDKQQNGNQDFLPWFLDQVKKHDVEKGISTIDVLDIHYFPEGLHNQNVDPETAAHRMRATRAFWDPTYIDESVINEPVFLIPRMKDLIAKHYPNLKLGISEWNMGADENINGALAIADVLGIFGREGVYYADYSTYPPKGSPGAFAFKMYTNYDDQGNKFGDTSVFAESENPNQVGAYASLDQQSGKIHLIVVNKNLKYTIQVKLNIDNLPVPKKTTLYRYSREDLDNIVKINLDWPEDGIIQTPPYSINHYILTP